MKQEIINLQELLKQRGIDAYIIPTNDYHNSEYVSDYFKCRAYMSNFTGSAGTLLVDTENAYLWTDGRYFIQAANQLKGTGITLMKSGQKGVPTLQEFICEHYSTIGFDGKLLSYKQAESYPVNKITQYDLIGEIWQDRPALPHTLAFIYDLKYCGERPSEKINRIRKEMKKYQAKYHLITSLDDIAWIFNIRGNDVECNPVVLAYALISLDQTILYLQHQALSYPVIEAMKSQNVEIRDYNEIYEDVKKLDGSVLLDLSKVNYNLGKEIKEPIDASNPSQLMKAIKNEVEVENTRKAHLKDGVAMTKFMYFLKNNIGKIPMTEMSVSDFLEDLRLQQGAIELSFETICGYQENAALMHYAPSHEHEVELKQEGVLLVDSGGQYLEGTTDITRTFVLGPISDIQKKHFTLVVKSNTQLAKAKFLYGTNSTGLDILARGPIWNEMIDYQCGTGHGVGQLLNVHEGPNNFRWIETPNAHPTVFEENMITTDEPGIYLENQYGIRIENELLCKKGVENEYGQFMYFENITICPIDLDGIDPQYLDQSDIDYINAYHQFCYDKLAYRLTLPERKWLEEYTRPIKK